MGLFERMMGFANQYKDDTGASDAEVERADRRSPREEELLGELGQMSLDSLHGGTGDSPIRLFMLFSGTVQGVGFRWTNASLAREHDLTGWVENLEDGTVRMEIQGRPSEIAGHLGRLHAYYSKFLNNIWLERTEDLPLVQDDREFRVRG